MRQIGTGKRVLLLAGMLLVSCGLCPSVDAAGPSRTSIRAVAGANPEQAAPAPAPIGAAITDCADCPEMVRIPDLEPGKPLFAGRYEITWHQYLVAAREASCGMPWIDNRRYDPAKSPLDDNYPVIGVSLDQIHCYIAWLNRKSGRNYRLPSAAEWEHLTRAGTSTDYYWGDEVGFGHAALSGRFDKEAVWRRVGQPREDEQRLVVTMGVAVPVGSFPPNPWGLYDTIGNAIEATTEAYPSFPTCVRAKGAEKCALYAGRGAGINLDYVDPSGKRATATVTRRPISRSGGNTLNGLRVVRD